MKSYAFLAGAALAAAEAPPPSPPNDRVVLALDRGWKFMLEGHSPAPSKPCYPSDFPEDLTNQKTDGLVERQAITEQDCATACCNCGADCDDSCETYQWCNSSACGYAPPSQGGCWVGAFQGAKTQKGEGWFSRARAAQPTPPPTPVPAGGCSADWCREGTDDGAWRVVSVPHDFVLEGNFSADADMSHGYLPYGVGFYRKHLTLPAEHAARLAAGTHTAQLDFDGVQCGAQVALGGSLLGSHASGYTPFSLKLGGAATAALVASAAPSKSSSPAAASSAAAAAAAPVVLAVRADATKPDGWWYDGGGMYRRARLLLLPMQHIAPRGGAYLPSTVVGPIDTAARTADAELAPSVTVVNAAAAGAAAAAVTVTVSLVAWDGTPVGTATAHATLDAGTNATLALGKIAMPNASLWSDVRPALYVATTTVATATTTDVVTTNIGVRKAAWSAETGFTLNDVPTKIRGNANHQDFAGIGVAVPDMLQAHRIGKLQEMGSNGWRTAHNPPNEALLDAADRMGMLVWDENHRNGQDDELTRLVLRDRNHPSIVIWSVCNEKLCDSTDTAGDFARMVPLFHALDPLGGRVVSANYNSIDTAASPLDLLGIDYGTSTYDAVHGRAPLKPLISSETSSAVSDRGEYHNDAAAGHVTGYDTESPGWGQTAEGAWGGVGQKDGQGILTRDFIAGGFTWTGWDYKGEPTPDKWPDINSHFGILDEAGFPKDRFHWYRAHFPAYGAGEGVLHLFPHWNWAASGDAAADAAPHMAPCLGRCALPPPSADPACAAAPFSSKSGVTCQGLKHLLAGDGSADACAAACCATDSRDWQWMSPDSYGNCWCGDCDGYDATAGWVGGTRVKGPPQPAGVVDVWVFSNAQTVELFLDGASLGARAPVAGNMSHFEWKVPFAAGNLSAVGRSVVGGANVTVAAASVVTTGAPAALRASIKDGVGGGGLVSGCDDVALVQVEVVDAGGNIVPTASSNITFGVAGPAAYAGGGNGDPACHVSDLSAVRPAYHGLALGVVKASADATAAGTVTVTVTSPGLKSHSLAIKAAPPSFDAAWWCGREQQL